MSFWVFRRLCACLEIIVRVWRADFAQIFTQDRAVFAEKISEHRRKSTRKARSTRGKSRKIMFQNSLSPSEHQKCRCADFASHVRAFCSTKRKNFVENEMRLHYNTRQRLRCFRALVFFVERTANGENTTTTMLSGRKAKANQKDGYFSDFNP